MTMMMMITTSPKTLMTMTSSSSPSSMASSSSSTDSGYPRSSSITTHKFPAKQNIYQNHLPMMSATSHLTPLSRIELEPMEEVSDDVPTVGSRPVPMVRTSKLTHSVSHRNLNPSTSCNHLSRHLLPPSHHHHPIDGNLESVRPSLTRSASSSFNLLVSHPHPQQSSPFNQRETTSNDVKENVITFQETKKQSKQSKSKSKKNKDKGQPEVEETATSIKVVVVGDSYSGKTHLIERIVRDSIPDVYVPTGFDKYSLKVDGRDLDMGQTQQNPVNVVIWDTSGHESYDMIRPLSYLDTDVFLICFDVNSQSSLNRVVKKWFPEIVKNFSTTSTSSKSLKAKKSSKNSKDSSRTPTTPPQPRIILCGCKSDLRKGKHEVSFEEDEKEPSIIDWESVTKTRRPERPVYPEQALEVSRKIKAVTYVETSSLTSGKSSKETLRVLALTSKDILNSSSPSPKLKKSTSLSTISKNCKSFKSLLKLPSSKSPEVKVTPGSSATSTNSLDDDDDSEGGFLSRQRSMVMTRSKTYNSGLNDTTINESSTSKPTNTNTKDADNEVHQCKIM